MDLWKTLLDENKNRVLLKEEKIWSYCNGNFKAHQCALDLSKDVYGAVIVRKDVLFEYDRSSYKKYVYSNFYLLIRDDIAKNEHFFILNYWTLLMGIKLHQQDTPFILVHVASSLDGKMATLSGHSKWIGNEENLIHAHRLRAITDGVLIGARTVTNDCPKLNVRHVEGKNPIRLILSNSSNCFENLVQLDGVTTYLLRNKKCQTAKYNYPFDKVIYFDDETNEETLKGLLQQLKSLGINSILIEGGATTISNFIKEKLVTVFQIHLAPILLGSGKAILNLPEIKEIGEGISVKNHFYTPMGNAMMITGNLW